MSTTAETATLAWGYTMADVDRYARRACGAVRTTIDAADRWDYAWHAIVELLYDSEERPSGLDLINAGCDAIREAGAENLHAHGLDRDTREPMPSYAKYWHGRSEASTGDGFSDRLIEMTALPQILGQLTPLEYEAIAALAARGSADVAADMLGIDRSTFYARVALARRRFNQFWFEHETPRRTFRSTDPAVCHAGHSRDEHGSKDAAGKWTCRICARNRQRDYRRRKKLGLATAA